MTGGCWEVWVIWVGEWMYGCMDVWTTVTGRRDGFVRKVSMAARVRVRLPMVVVVAES